MKKSITLCAVLFLCFCLFATETVRPKTVITDASLPVSNNPAYVYFYDLQYSVKVSASLEDEISFNDPSFHLKSSVIGDNLAAKINAAFLLENPISTEESVFYDSVEKFDFDISSSIGVSRFSAGVGVSLSSRLTRKGIEVRNEHKFLDVIKEAVQEHDRDKNGTETNIRIGLMYNYESFWTGLLCDDLFTYKNGFSQFSFANLLDSMTLGISYCGPLYDSRGRINMFSFSSAVEAGHMFDSDRMTLLFGGRVVVQYVRERTVALEGWYRTRLSSFGTGEATIIATAGIDNLFLSITLNNSFAPYKDPAKLSVEFSAQF